MKYILTLVLVASLMSCGTDIEDVDPEAPVTEETVEELKNGQDENVEIEELDGELDSLINEIE